MTLRGETIAHAANATNNAMHQRLRLDRWGSVRDALWRVIERHCAPGVRVALVGAGSCDDVPLERLARHASSIDLIDFDKVAVERARARLPRELRRSTTMVIDDVVGGAADIVLCAVRDDEALPDTLPLPYGPLGRGDYDLVIGDMLYTQLLHAGLIALDVHGTRQHELMHRYDPPLVAALVERLHASAAPTGHVIHVHDVACWAPDHDQPVPIETVLDDPDAYWRELRRHDACDPYLVAKRIGARIVEHAWWRWPFEPRKQFLVRATVARAGVRTMAGWARTANGQTANNDGNTANTRR